MTEGTPRAVPKTPKSSLPVKGWGRMTILSRPRASPRAVITAVVVCGSLRVRGKEDRGVISGSFGAPEAAASARIQARKVCSPANVNP
jgi:hypothetical protein